MSEFSDLAPRPLPLSSSQYLHDAPVARPKAYELVPEKNDDRKKPEVVIKYALEEATLDLKAINLIGVVGPPEDRRALILYPNQKIRKLKAGDSFNGGRVINVGKDNIIYIKSRRNYILRMQ